MPHHHVPEAKETSPIVDRLRLQLNRTVRRTVTEAVDAVWAAFEDELTQVATLPPITPAVDDYEVFYDCCSRLAKFIESNMDTTPGFLEQMDRLILACHSGVMGRSVLTKDLRIRRGSKMRNETEHANTKTGQLRARKPVIPPPSGSRGMMDEASDEELKAVGDEEKTVDEEPFATDAASIEKSEAINDDNDSKAKKSRGHGAAAGSTRQESLTVKTEPSERGTAPNGKQARDESPSKCDNDVVTKVNGVADNEEELESKTNPRVLEHASKLAERTHLNRRTTLYRWETLSYQFQDFATQECEH
ncbi:hypothetical protein PInf_012947 [Phytophthora infestans]|nr:hypothetical protein PInf_012947 [Phytophthora infestans]